MYSYAPSVLHREALPWAMSSARVEKGKDLAVEKRRETLDAVSAHDRAD